MEKKGNKNKMKIERMGNRNKIGKMREEMRER